MERMQVLLSDFFVCLVLQPHLVILELLSLVVAAAGAFLVAVAPS